MITVLSWLWHNPACRTQFTAGYVNIWADMVRRNLSMPHRIACVTSTPSGIDPSIEIITPPGDFEDVTPQWGPRKPNCFRRLSMFRRDAAKIFGERFICMDLDCVIGGPLDPLFDRKDDLVIFKGTAPDRPYNGSMMLIKAGCRPKVYEKFNQRQADISGQRFVGSDQAWLAHCLGWNEATWGEDDGVWHLDRYLKNCRKVEPRLLFFPGKRKPWDLAQVFPWMKRNYCLTMKEAA